jgi:putative heme iron utilization protein
MTEEEDVAARARGLMRGLGPAALATIRDGAPNASLVTPACLPDLTPVLLLSSLAEHTRALAVSGKCSLLFLGQAAAEDGLANPQTIPRVTVRGTARPTAEPLVRRRYLAVHPYAAQYAVFGDFGFWVVGIESVHMVGGFAQAVSLTPAALMGAACVAADFAAAEEAAVARCNTDRAAALSVLGARATGRQGAWTMVAADPDGADLVWGRYRARIAFQAPLAHPEDLDAVIGALIDRPSVQGGAGRLGGIR